MAAAPFAVCFAMLLAGVPDPDIVAKVTAWGQRLSGVISDVPLPNTPEGTPTVPVKEALDIIKVCAWALGKSSQCQWQASSGVGGTRF